MLGFREGQGVEVADQIEGTAGRTDHLGQRFLRQIYRLISHPAIIGDPQMRAGSRDTRSEWAICAMTAPSNPMPLAAIMDGPVFASIRYPKAEATASSRYRTGVQSAGATNRIETSMPSTSQTAWPAAVKSFPTATTVAATASHQPAHAGRHRGGIAALSVPSTAEAP